MNSLHQMGHKPGNFVPQTLAGDNGDLLTYSLIGIKVERQSSIILLDDHPRCLFNRLGTYSALEDGTKVQLVADLENRPKFYSPCLTNRRKRKSERNMAASRCGLSS